MNDKIFPLLFLFLVSNALISAQNQEFSQTSSWNSLSIKLDMTDQWFLKNEVNLRRTNFLEDWQQIVLRPSVQYKMFSGLTAATGYSFIQNYSFSDFSAPNDFKEHNLWQQVFLKQEFKYFSISHRARFEERFKQEVATVDSTQVIEPGQYSGRLRYRFIITVPLLKKQHVSAVLYDEAFLDFEQGWQPKNLDQNWIFMGLRFRESEHITITSGYHQINLPRENKTITNHIWETSLIYTL